MNQYLTAVQMFQRKFSRHFHDSPSLDIPQSVKEMRVAIMQEEMAEVVEAIQQNDLPAIAKELADVLYTVLGTVDTYGLSEKFDDIFAEVHRSNMTKEVSFEGKAVKGNGYQPAEIEKLLSTGQK